MEELARRYECWLDRKNKILSFHYVANFAHKRFENYVSFINFAYHSFQNGFKIQ